MVGQRPQQVFLSPLLVGTDGSQKMSKSLGNYIGVAEPPNEIYGKVMSINDELIMDYFELLTDVPDEELGEFRGQLGEQTVNPMVSKKRLARELVTQLYDQKAASEAEGHFASVFQRREMPEEIREGTKSGDTLRDYLVKNQLAKSRSEAKRLIEQGAVEVDGNKITETDMDFTVSKGVIIKVGKRSYIKST
jgi:tyrosyl-tRNA synthetase